jgi:hypothetical protein
MWGKHMLMHGHVRIQARGFGNWPTRQWSTVTWGHASSMLHRCKQHCAWYLEQWVRGGGGAQDWPLAAVFLWLVASSVCHAKLLLKQPAAW